jgi:polar amino acid transport system permease protein
MLGAGRGVFVSTISTIVFFAVLVAIVVFAPGSREVANDFFSLEAMREAFVGTETTPSIGSAFLLNVRMFLIAEVFILILALVIAVIRQIPGPVFFPLRAVAVAYTDFFRGVPLLLVIYLFGFGIPGLEIQGISNQSPVVLGVAALVLSYSAYVAEVYRAGIDNVSSGQWEAAKACNLKAAQTWRHVILPQAIPPMIPALANYFIAMFKETPLLSAITVLELMSQARGIANFNYRYLEPMTLVGVFFLIISLISVAGLRALERRFGRLG